MMLHAPWPTCPSQGWHAANPLLFWLLSVLPSSPRGARPCWVALAVVLQLAPCSGWRRHQAALPLLAARAMWGHSGCQGLLQPHLLPIGFVQRKLQLEKQPQLSVPQGFPSHSAERLSQHNYPSWYHFCAKGPEQSTGHLVPISKKHLNHACHSKHLRTSEVFSYFHIYFLDASCRKDFLSSSFTLKIWENVYSMPI